MIPLAVPNLTGNEKEYLINCIETTYVSTVGEYVNKFEEAVARETGSKYAVATSAGTTALHAALTALGVTHGDLVIIPSFTFIATANTVAYCGATPWVIDINEHDWCLNPDIVSVELKKNCVWKDGILIHKPSSRRVAALMPVYILGNIPDMDKFREIADEYHLPLIVDAACAIGAKYKGKNFGSLADMSILSFNGNKTITCGGGGAIVGDDEQLLSLTKHLTTTARVWPDYDFDMVGYNYRLTNIQAAVGVGQMEKLDQFVDKKRFVHRYYSDYISNSAISCFPVTEGGAAWFSGIVMPENYSLEDTRRVCNLINTKGIDARLFWKPVHLQKPFREVLKGDMKITEKIWERIICLPSSTNILRNELEYVVNVINAISI